MTVSLIAAVARNGMIGNGGKIPWDLPADLKYFAEKTKGHPVIMGFRTFKSIQDRLGGPLKGRRNIVLVNRHAECEGCRIAWSVEEALEKAGNSDRCEVFVIGGKAVYEKFLPLSDCLYITRVDGEFDGDTHFPEIAASDWELVSSTERTKDEKNPYDLVFEVYKRRKVFVVLDHARSDAQRNVMEGIAKDGVCPFCPENLGRYHTQETLMDGKFWILTFVQWPRDNTRLHLLAIYKPHAETLGEMDPKAGEELIEFLSWAESNFHVKGGLFFIRFGDPSHSSASVKHLHAQFVVPAKERPGFEPVRFRVG